MLGNIVTGRRADQRAGIGRRPGGEGTTIAWRRPKVETRTASSSWQGPILLAMVI